MSFETGWRKCTWGDISTLEYGKALRDYKDKTSGYPVYGTNGLIGYTEKYLSDKPGVIIGRKGAYRGVHYSNRPFFVIDTAYYLSPKIPQLNLRWAYYSLRNIDINSMDSGSAIPSTSRSDFYSIEVDLPDIYEQQKIANLLSVLDDKIELNNAINKNLEEMAQALFNSWFVDFEFPNENGEPYKSSGGEFEESELGLIPKGWKVRTLGEFCEISTTSINPVTLPDIIFEHYSLPAFDSGRLPVFESGSEIKSNKYKVSKNSILVSKLNPETKRIWNPYCLTEYAICSTEFMNYIPINSRLRAYSYSILNSEGFHQYLVGNTTGSTNSRQRVNPKATLQYKFVYGGTDIAYIFNDLVSAIYKKINENTLENKYLASTRDTLLPKLMSGEIRVPVERDHSAPDLPMVAESSTIYQP
ncbi:restriction endonuclease subunit S [Paenibacillus thailandensis]|uniref:Restriction endonuclease subunit S n=1 Tax=Paenibacillus thailandensis TaxID=393250 RepID=A0ABW5QW65_9BACL